MWANKEMMQALDGDELKIWGAGAVVAVTTANMGS
jgi:hypothetical protein